MSAPKTVAAATRLLERYADLSGRVALVDADRNERIASANVWADTAAGPMLTEMDTIAGKLEQWWPQAASDLAGDRKSIELGGCTIGTRKARAALSHSFESEVQAVEALRASRYGNRTTKVKYTLDRAATLKLLQIGGKTAASVRELGFAIDEGADLFFVKRAEQAGTITSAS